MWLKNGLGSCLHWCPWCSFTECEGQVEWAEMNSQPEVIFFTRGRWRELFDAALRVEVPVSGKWEVLSEDQRRERAAQDRVERGQVSRVRQELVGSLLVPKTAETLTELRRRRPQVPLREIPQEVMQFEPESPLHLDLKIFSVCFRSAPSGSAPGPGGCTNEMLKVCLDDQETFNSWASLQPIVPVPRHLGT